MDHVSYEQQIIKNLASAVPADKKCIDDLYALAAADDESSLLLARSNNHLFMAYPGLAGIPYLKLGKFPTPIHEATELAKQAGISALYIKLDSLSGKPGLFGGNKVRKLEFLLADALVHNARTVLTFGCAGSNHATATATYAHHVGLKTILMLLPQPHSDIVKRNLMLNHQAQAKMHMSETNNLRAAATITQCAAHKQTYGSFPYVIPTGGSCPLGTLGFVNAMFELKDQIEQGLLTEPDHIYVALGSAGTIVGMLIGAQLAGIKSTIHGITVFPENKQGFFTGLIQTLFDQTVALLRSHDATIPNITLAGNKYTLIYDAAGKEYAEPTGEGTAAQLLLKNLEGIDLDPVYSAKAFAGMLEHSKQRVGTILFWNTFYATHEDPTLWKNYDQLPLCLHKYFSDDQAPAHA